MSKKTILIILIASIAVNIATVITFVYYWTSEHKQVRFIDPQHPDRFPQWHGGRLVRELDLDPQQIETLKKVNEEIRISGYPIREKLHMKRQELMSMVHDQRHDQDRIDRLIKEIATLQAEHDTRIFTELMKIREILTPEQQDRLGMLIHSMIGPEGPPRTLHKHGIHCPPSVREGK